MGKQNEPVRVCYIASSSHSGTTILSRYLCKEKGFLSLGEIHLTWLKYLSDKDVLMKEICSCGQSASSCNFWSEIFSIWNLNHGLQNAYSELVKFCMNQYPEFTIVDSSKYIKGISPWMEFENVDLRVIHLVKDVRNYTVSQIDNALKKGVRRKLPGFRHHFFWWQQHQRLIKFLNDNQLNSILMSYEKWAIEPTFMFLNKVNGLNNPLNIINPKKADSVHHILTGNNSRLTSDIDRIVYDYRWFHRNEWLLAYLLMGPIRKFNTEIIKNEET